MREDELHRADDVCQQVSKLLDKRLYRMPGFYFALALDVELSDRDDRVQASLKEYDTVLYEWNDSLNLNLALIGAYFGEGARDWLDAQLYEHFKRVGAALEDYCLRSARGLPADRTLTEMKADLDSLGNQVYQLGVFMTTQLREGRVGRTAPRPLQLSQSPGDVRAPGATRRV